MRRKQVKETANTAKAMGIDCRPARLIDWTVGTRERETLGGLNPSQLSPWQQDLPSTDN